MSRLLLLTNALAPSAEILPALGLLSHHVRILPAEAAALVNAPEGDAILVDSRRELAAARSLCRILRATGTSIPVIAILTEGGLAGVTGDWGVDEVLLDTAGPAEVEARLRLSVARLAAIDPVEDAQITAGEVMIDEVTYVAKVGGRALDLTYKEFELLKYLAQHPGRVFTRAQLLQEVWGYDYYGGTRTVDVHIRRLRAKLGGEHELLIGTVRNVGYAAGGRGRAAHLGGSGRGASPRPGGGDGRWGGPAFRALSGWPCRGRPTRGGDRRAGRRCGIRTGSWRPGRRTRR